MSDLLIVILSLLTVYHSVGRLAHFPSLKSSPWRCKILAVSSFAECAGAFAAFGCATTGTGYLVPVVLLLTSAALAPFAERRQLKGA